MHDPVQEAVAMIREIGALIRTMARGSMRTHSTVALAYHRRLWR
ncbi:hypothetical protein [Nocardia sp. NPDC052566]